MAAAALAKLDATNLEEDWYFSMAVEEEDELRLIQSDPHRAKYERRALLSINGVTPDGDRLETFREEEVKRIDELDADRSGFAYMVDTQTLALIDSSEGYATLSFSPRVNKLEEARDQLSGTVLLNTDTRQIEEIQIRNTETLSPAFSVTVESYRLTLQFQQEQGEILLKKLESRAVGKAGFLKSFDTLVSIEFSDYKRAES